MLPFLPDGKFGPFGAWNPQTLWLVVLLVTGFSFARYLANRTFGARHGAIYPALAALALGGTVLANMAVKLGITITFASSRGKAAAYALVASMLALAATLALGMARL